MDMMNFIEKGGKRKVPGGYLIIKMGSRSDKTRYYPSPEREGGDQI